MTILNLDLAAAGRRPWLLVYTLAIFVVMLTASAYHIRASGIFACPARGYAGDHYLAYCNADGYGDFDHGAFWFDLDPVSRQAAAAAEVLFVGNSRLEFGFSAPPLGQWFADNKLTYYLLGFSYSENVNFLKPLLERIRPQARAYVINVDNFFVDKVTVPAREVMAAPDAASRSESKLNWQFPHQDICRWLPFACDEQAGYYRQRTTGEWVLDGHLGDRHNRNLAPIPTSVGPDRGDDRLAASEQAAARDFIAGLGVPPDCVILTYVPTGDNQRQHAVALAGSLGLAIESPQLDGLRTFDGSHLDPQSAERFTRAFMAQAGRQLQSCLKEPA